MRNYFFATLFLGLFTVLFWAERGIAAEPWRWEMTLQETDGGSIMLLPAAVHIDPDLERYYVVDSGNNRILTFDKAGSFFKSFTASKQLKKPFDMVREKGILWLVEKERNSLTRIDLKGKKISPKIITDQDRVVYPDRIELDKESVYLLDKATGTVLVLDKKNLQVTSRFSCIDCDNGFVDFKLRNGKLWALEQSGKAVYKFSYDGVLDEVIQLDAAELDFPRSIEVDESGFLYILDRHKGLVSVFDVKGRFKYSLFEAGQARGKLYYPIEVKFDPWGRLCVVDEGNGRVQIFTRR
jgi:DNA-binding beta-propeller fold protein YncE